AGGTAPLGVGRTGGAAISLLLPWVVARKRGERLGGVAVAPLVIAPFAGRGGAAVRASPFTPGRISPRNSWYCCCNSIVALAICSQPCSNLPEPLDFDHVVTGRALPKAGCVVARPLKCPRSPSVTETEELVMSERTSAMRLRPC